MSNNFHLQLYRGTTAQNNAYTGPAGELTVDTQTNNIRLHDGSTAGGVVIGGMPTGSIIPFGGSTAPDGYLLCDGSAVSRSTYSALFAVIGTTYGPGDGNSTFNLPDSGTGLVKAGDIPCKGNSISLGMTNGTNNGGIANGYTTNNTLAVWTGSYGANIGTTRSGNTVATDITWGITTDPTKSGIIADTTSLTLTCKCIIKY